jgi:hypothetical protein
MTIVICNDGLRDIKPSNDMIEYEQCYSSPSVIECRHRLGPFSEIIHIYNNVSMPPDQVRVTCHEVNAPFRKWTNKNYRVKRSRVRSDIMITSLASMAFLDDSNAILKQLRPEVTSLQDLLGSDTPRHMIATFSRVTIIQSFLNFIVGKASSKNGVNTTEVKSITEDDKMMSLISYLTTIRTRKVGPKILSLDNISIP